MRSPGRLERFESDWNSTTLAKSGPAASSTPEGGCSGVDFRVAFVAENQESKPPGKADDACQIGVVGHRALRVGGRGDEERHGARQQLAGERVEVGQEAGRGGRRQIDRLAIGRHRARRIGGIERVGHQHRRPPASAADPARRGDRGEKQSLARAIEHQDFVWRVDRARQLEASAEPVRCGLGRNRRAPCSSDSGRTRRCGRPAPGQRTTAPHAAARRPPG